MLTSPTRPVRWASDLVFHLAKIFHLSKEDSDFIHENLIFFQGLPGTKNFYLETESGVSVGVWHILPLSLVGESEGKGLDWWDTRLGDGR